MRHHLVIVCLISTFNSIAWADNVAVAVMPLQTKTVDASKVGVLDNFLVAAIADLGRYRVVSPSDINALLGLEKMKDAAGCGDISCAAEIGGALGVDYLFVGTVDIMGSTLLLTGALLDIRNAEAVERRKVQRKDDETLYLQAVQDLIDAVFAQRSTAPPRSTTEPQNELPAKPTQIEPKPAPVITEPLPWGIAAYIGAGRVVASHDDGIGGGAGIGIRSTIGGNFSWQARFTATYWGAVGGTNTGLLLNIDSSIRFGPPTHLWFVGLGATVQPTLVLNTDGSSYTTDETLVGPLAELGFLFGDAKNFELALRASITVNGYFDSNVIQGCFGYIFNL